MCLFCITIWKGEHAQVLLIGVAPGGKTPTTGALGRGPTCFSPTSHLFPDGHSRFTDSMLHGDLVREPRVHVYWFRLRHDPALGQRTGRSSLCARTIEGSKTASPPCLPAQKEAWTAPPALFYLLMVTSSNQAGGDVGADNPARRSRGYDGPMSRGPRGDVG